MQSSQAQPDEDETASLSRELRAQRDILIELRTLLKAVIKDKEDHENRIRRLEERKFPLPTLAVAVSLAALVATIAMFIAK